MTTCAVCHTAPPYHRSVFGDLCAAHLPVPDIDAMVLRFFDNERDYRWRHYDSRMKPQHWSDATRIPLPDTTALYEVVR